MDEQRLAGSVTLGVALLVTGIVAFLTALVVAVGLDDVQPRRARVLTLFGDDRGSDLTPGLRRRVADAWPVR